MRKLAAGLLAGALCLVVLNGVNSREAKRVEPMIGHMVYFKLADDSPAAAAKLLASCKKHLTGHPGEAFFAAGLCAKEFDRPVNDREWDVALHVVFKTKADHDKYQDAERHKQFIEENKGNWKKVRVFDSSIEPTGK